MTRRVTTRTLLDTELGRSPDLARRLDKLGVLAPVAKDVGRGGETYFDVGAASIVERAATLLAAGYAPKDIALVLGRVEPGRREPVVDVLALDALATRAAVDPERIAGPGGWVDRGLVTAWAVDDAGRPLFVADAVARVRAIAALEALGLGELAADWVAGTIDAPRIRARLVEVEAAAKVLARALPKLARKRKPRVRGQTRLMPAPKSDKAQ